MPRNCGFDQRVLARLLTKQHAVVARAQALACGMSEKAVRCRVREGGRWQALLPGVYLAHTGSPSADQREIGALLYAGPRAVLTGAAALRRFDLVGLRTGFIDVLVPADVQKRDVGFARLHRTTRLPERICVAGEIRWPDAGVVAEVDSRAWHLSPRDWEHTLARHARMSAHGIIVLHFTPGQISSRRNEVVLAIRNAITSGRSRPLPHLRTVPSC